jgi:exodeoxyribonuclease-3
MKRIISYNVNGLRSAVAKGFQDWLEAAAPDVICLQEIKMQAYQRPEMYFQALGYYSFFHFAQKKGYSGVGLVCRQEPDRVEYGIGFPAFDAEGRVVRADFGDLTIVSVYIPSGTMGDIRQQVKMEFLAAFAQWVKDLQQQRPRLILSGDYNICHKPIDINHPERHLKSSGFLPEERAWFDDFLAGGFIDSFRHFDSSAEKYSWWSYRSGARAKNLGWRIDYHLVSTALQASLQAAEILPQVLHSDHCPVVLDLKE